MDKEEKIAGAMIAGGIIKYFSDSKNRQYLKISGGSVLATTGTVGLISRNLAYNASDVMQTYLKVANPDAYAKLNKINLETVVSAIGQMAGFITFTAVDLALIGAGSYMIASGAYNLSKNLKKL